MNDAQFDAVVVGGGLAGMLAALELQPLSVALVSYGPLGESTSSAWAQGGIAAALGDDDSPALHSADTVAAGGGIVERRVAERLAADAPHAIERIARRGVHFDRDASDGYALGREAAHSRSRIVHAGGDATGAELVRALAVAVRESEAVTCFENARARDVMRDAAGNVAGVSVILGGEAIPLRAPAVVLCTGGIGGLYRHTTNPTTSRGAGIAMAARAGARLADLEFVQFHPTVLDVARDPLPLVSEAVRGAGAWLVDDFGNRIMAGVDPALELAARDVVARRVYDVARLGRHVFLDARASVGAAFPERFPTVYAACRAFGIDPRHQAIPVVAAEHYHMGGVAVDVSGRTSVRGLYACGEVAATGVHGANRLASNSLLESVVYPERIANDVRALRSERTFPTAPVPAAATDAEALDATAAEWFALRDEMYERVGIVRERRGLEQAVVRLRTLGADSPSEAFRDAAFVASLIAQAALRRCESRGSHYRSDFPDAAPEERHRSFISAADALGGERSA